MDFANLIRSLLSAQKESECVEFKRNNSKPEEIGEYISALSNSASLFERPFGWLIWGVEDATKEVIGTTFRPRDQKIGNEELESWLSCQLTPDVNFFIFEGQFEGKDVVVFQIPATPFGPIRFRDTAYIRSGTYKKKLRDFPEKERMLWIKTSLPAFEGQIAISDITPAEAFSLLEIPKYFSMMGQGIPSSEATILDRFVQERLILKDQTGLVSITNLGAILFAKRLENFDSLQRKAVRVIHYKGKTRIDSAKEIAGTGGYASYFEPLIAYIQGELPKNEHLGQALRAETPLYPDLVIRELVANALIHQDFAMKGDSPMVEIFEDRLEITNAGVPLINPLRFIDEPPQSRNEALAGLMRRLGICEERGSGIDKVITAVEFYQLPAPEFIVTENHTKAIVYGPGSFSSMDRKDKIRACYQHACLRFVSGQQMTNASLRSRLSITEPNYAIASRIISDTIAASLVKIYDPDNTSRKHAKYVPYWA